MNSASPLTLLALLCGSAASGSAQAADGVFVANYPGSTTGNVVCDNDGLGGLDCSATDTNGIYSARPAGDLDGDGLDDLVAWVAVGSTFETQFCSSDGDGTFSCSTIYSGYGGISIGDMDEDGDDDVVIAGGEFRGFGVQVCLNDGESGFTCTENETTFSTTGKMFSGSETGDFNADGHADVFLTGSCWSSSCGGPDGVCLGDGTGALDCDAAEPNAVYGHKAGQPKVADIDGDGYEDVIYSTDGASVGSVPAGVRTCINDGTGLGWDCTTETSQVPSGGLAVADFDQDGHVDYAYSVRSGATLEADIKPSEICFNDGTGAFDCETLEVPTLLYSNGKYYTYYLDMVVGDLDGDSNPDIGLVGYGSGLSETQTCVNDGTGAFDCTAVDTNSSSRAYSLVFGSFSESAASTDGDGVCDTTDVVDGDSDGVTDDCDAFPADPTETVDTDGDGIGDSADLCGSEDATGYDSNDDGCIDDTDNDGVIDSEDAFPDDDTEWTDTDGDGVGDNSDAFPMDNTEDTDTDGDEVGDNTDSCHGYPNDDTDGDGVCDSDDSCPTDALDADDDDDGICDVEDICVGSDNIDTDEDQVCDDIDACDGNDASGDYDDDGLCGDIDNCPAEANADQADDDGDDIGNACDDDDDGDAVTDVDDNCPDDANADQSDLDGDGDGDACDDDDDGDGVADDEDVCPFYSDTDQSDLDGDGVGDVCDGDDDGDGVSDDTDLCAGTALDAPFDTNGCSGEQFIELKCGTPADYSWRRSGKFTRCVVRKSKAAQRKGLLTQKERQMIIRRSRNELWMYRWRIFLRRWC